MGGFRAAAEAHRSCRPSSGSLAHPYRKLRPCTGIAPGPWDAAPPPGRRPFPTSLCGYSFLASVCTTHYRSIISVHNTAGGHKEREPRHLGTRAGVFFLFQVCCVCVVAVEKLPLLVRSHLECIPYSAPQTEKWVNRLCASHTVEY